jgi:hypothetical protein
VDEHAREELERLDQGVVVEVVPSSGFRAERLPDVAPLAW